MSGDIRAVLVNWIYKSQISEKKKVVYILYSLEKFDCKVKKINE